jgi:5-methylcytosine-specific restriction endonuclease McrA
MGMNEWRGNAHKRRKITADVKARYGFVCWLCGGGIGVGEYSVDHLIPQSVNPSLTWDLDYLRPAHRRCNSSRGAGKRRPTAPKHTREW